MSSRLFANVREKHGLCYSVYASYESFRDRGAIVGYAGARPELAQETLDRMLDELYVYNTLDLSSLSALASAGPWSRSRRPRPSWTAGCAPFPGSWARVYSWGSWPGQRTIAG